MYEKYSRICHLLNSQFAKLASGTLTHHISAKLCISPPSVVTIRDFRCHFTMASKSGKKPIWPLMGSKASVFPLCSHLKIAALKWRRSVCVGYSALQWHQQRFQFINGLAGMVADGRLPILAMMVLQPTRRQHFQLRA